MDVETNKERSKKAVKLGANGRHKAWILGYIITVLLVLGFGLTCLVY